MQAVYITSYMAVTACGHGVEPLREAVFEQRSCLSPARLIQPDFTIYTGEVDDPLPSIQEALKAYNTRNARLALAALDCENEAFRSAVSLAVDSFGAARVGVIIGTSTSGIYETELSYASYEKNGKATEGFDLRKQHSWVATAEFIKHELQLLGPCYAISTACSSSGKAIAAGQRMIASGICDAVVVGGVDSMCQLTIHGFHSLELTADLPCTPLDVQRQGISLGEGAGLLLLERQQRESGQLSLVGYGESSDAHHMTAPHPEGEGSKRAMQSALQAASLQVSDIDYVNLHATGTRLNDQSEMRAMASLFHLNTPCSATKGITGHTLGAAGAIESIISLLALEYQFIPGTCGLNTIDPAFKSHVVSQPLQDQHISYVMNNNFGFGGNNVSLIFATQSTQKDMPYA
ncbi:MAG: beta-ketoacyl-[acyl-carrier-protein] synthase II [Proteobacteria bacterium]|nr:MAG: beta-ketoacyl-[acyl-carrier-protein] synthase II [Pseudomonadota bacterium]